MKTAIVSCKCKHEFQDKEYGKGKRLANPCTKRGKLGEKLPHACTVCDQLHYVQGQ